MITLTTLLTCALSFTMASTYPVQSPEKINVPVEERTVYINSITERNGDVILSTDTVEFFFGDEAVAPMLVDGLCKGFESNCYPLNNYYVRNQVIESNPIILNPTTEIAVQSFHVDPDGEALVETTISTGDFITLFNSKKEILTSTPYYLDIKDGILVGVTEQYIP